MRAPEFLRSTARNSRRRALAPSGIPRADGIALWAGLLLFGYTLWDPTYVPGPPCVWKALLGHECPGCGLTRALCLLLRGHLFDAVRLNPLVLAVVPTVGWHLLSRTLPLAWRHRHG